MSPVTAKAALLQALTLGLGHGLDLIRRVRERTAGRVRLGQGSVYPALWALEREGLLWAQVVPGQGGAPRHRYGLTEAGVRAAAEQRAAVGALYGFLL